MEKNSEFIQIFKKQAHFIIGVPFFIWVIFVFNYIGFPTLAPLIHVLIFAVLLIWRWWKSEEQQWNISKFVLILGLFVAFQLGQLLITPLPQYSFVNVLMNIAIFLTIITFEFFISKEEQMVQWEKAWVSYMVFLLILEIIPVFLWYRSWWKLDINGSLFPPTNLRLSGIFFGGPNNLAMYTNLSLPIILIWWLNSKSRPQKIKFGLLLVLISVIHYYCSSRSAWLAAVAGIGISLFLYYFPDWRSYIEGMKINWEKIWITIKGKMVSGLVFLFFFIGIGFLLFIQVQKTPGHYGFLSGREFIWQNSFEIWLQSFFLGNGLRSFPILYANKVLLPPGFLPADAHILWLQLGIESGVIGIVLTILAIVFVGRSWLRAWKAAPKDGNKRNMLIAYAGVCTAAFVVHLAAYTFEFFMYTLFLLLISIFILNLDPEKPVIRLNKNLVLLVLLGFVGIYIWGSYFTNRGFSDYQVGLIEYTENKDIEASQKSICKSHQENPEFTFYAFQCALVSAQLAYEQDDFSLIQSAEEIQVQALQTNPQWPIHWANLALLRWQLGDYQQAILNMQYALEKAPRNSVLALNLGWMEEQLGILEAAETHYYMAIENDPWLAASPFWEENPTRRDVIQINLSEIIEEDPRRFLALQGYQAYQDGQYELARNFLEESIQLFPTEADAYAVLGLVEQAQGNPEKAWENIQIALFINEESPRVPLWAAFIAFQQNKQEDGLALLEQGYSSWLGYINYSHHYYILVYYQVALPFDLVPGHLRADVTPETLEVFNLLEDDIPSLSQW